MKAVLRRKLIALSASKKKLERAITRSMTAQLKALEQKEADTPREIEERISGAEPIIESIDTTVRKR